MPSKLTVDQKNAVSRISGLVLVNAMIFQEILAEEDTRVQPVQTIAFGPNPIADFCDHWQFIIEKIDYFAIFHIGREILANITAAKSFVDALKSLARTAQEIVGMRAALRHDLMGRVYHRLLAEKKYLGTYYTSIPAATLLLKLALQQRTFAVNWESLREVKRLRIADIACGTGTLLMAAADAVNDNYISASANAKGKVDVGALQSTLVEYVLYGYDVLASAIHLTASTLAMRAPHVAFTNMNLWCLPLGGIDHRLGSIEFLQSSDIGHALDLFGAAPASRRVTGKVVTESHRAHLPDLDLCVMNPPFTRSVGGNLLFGSLPAKERAEAQKRLKTMVKALNGQANITAGLGSVFVAAGDKYLKEGGRMALVLPKAVLSGVAWAKTRSLLQQKYSIDYLIASHDPERWNFSENTSLSEVLIIATRNKKNTGPVQGQVTAVNLWRNPSTSFEALAIAHALTMEAIPELDEDQGTLELRLGQTKVGEAVRVRSELMDESHSWLLPCSFAQSDLIRVTERLLQGELWIPGRGSVGLMPLCNLDKLGLLGPDARDIHDGFSLSQGSTAYPALWGHDADAIYIMAQKPNRHLQPLPKAKTGRPLRKTQDLWPLSGRVLIAERMRLNSQKVAAVRVSRPVLSSVWWPLRFTVKGPLTRYEKAMTAWLNSTPGILLLLSRRLETEGPWVKFKKPSLSGMPVLDVTVLSRGQLNALAGAYDRLSNETLLTFPEMTCDRTRTSLDDSVSRLLKLPSFSELRLLLAREPLVCARRI